MSGSSSFERQPLVELLNVREKESALRMSLLGSLASHNRIPKDFKFLWNYRVGPEDAPPASPSSTLKNDHVWARSRTVLA